ncbi:S1 family peptidase [Catenulispora subtropica]
MTQRRYLAIGISALAVATSAMGFSGSVAHAASRTLDTHGITVLMSRPAPAAVLTADQSAALDAAELQSENDPSDFSFPYVDRKTGTVVVTSATASGRSRMAALASRPLPSRGEADPKGGLPKRATPAVPRRVADVGHSRAYLQRIMDEAIGVGPLATVGADYPDPEQGKVVLEVTALSQAHLDDLAKRYDPAALEIVVAPRAISSTQGRWNDSSPFRGGDAVRAPNGSCTGGFPWHSWDGSAWHDYLLTAGHCGPRGGTVQVDSDYATMGSMQGLQSSWTAGTGSWQLPNMSYFTGDIGLIHIENGQNAVPQIYVGDYVSSNVATVKQMWTQRPSVGDQYCTGGAYSGELCGWVTTAARSNWTYSDGTVARNVSWGTRGGACTQAGDSGGTVYTVRSDGGIAAKGIHDGGGTYSNGTCVEIYSDIFDAYYAYPGNLQTW